MKKLVKGLLCIIAAVALLLCAVPVSATYIENVSLNTEIVINLSDADDYGSFWFTAPESCVYKFYSIGDYDTVAYLVDADNEFIAYGDDTSDDLNFAVYYYLEAGKTYGFIADFLDEAETGSFKVCLTKTDVKSVKFNDITVYEGIDNSYDYYSYTPSFSVTLKSGKVLQSDEYGCLEYDGNDHYSYCTDGQEEGEVWGLGTHYATGELFGISQSFKVTVEKSPVKSVVFKDITLYEGWDSIVIDEEWNDILGVEITEPITIYVYAPVYTVTMNDGTVLHSDELGYVEYNGSYFSYSDLLDDQAIDNQWGIGEHTATATVLGVTQSFKVTVMPNPAQSVEFKDLTILKDWDYFTDYDYNPETEDYDLAWQHYVYTPSYTVILNDGTVLESDENGYLYFNNKTYGALGFDDGQSYETPWKEGTYPVTIRAFGEEHTFNVTLEEMVSVSGDINRDGNINNRDLALLMQYLNAWDVRLDKGAGDVNGDGILNNRDYALLMQYLNKWDVELL